MCCSKWLILCETGTCEHKGVRLGSTFICWIRLLVYSSVFRPVWSRTRLIPTESHQSLLQLLVTLGRHYFLDFWYAWGSDQIVRSSDIIIARLWGCFGWIKVFKPLTVNRYNFSLASDFCTDFRVPFNVGLLECFGIAVKMIFFLSAGFPICGHNWKPTPPPPVGHI